MELRDIRIDKFGCWEDVLLMGLPSGPSVIHLDDGGQPIDFSRFFHEALFGFENDKVSLGGSLVFSDGNDVISIDRQQAMRKKNKLRVKRNSQPVDVPDRWLKVAQAATPAVLADRFFLPTETRTAVDNFSWLATQPDLLETLLEEQPQEESVQQVSPELRAEQIELENQRSEAAERFERLSSQDERLRDEISELELELQEANHKASNELRAPSPATLAELKEESRRIKQRMGPFEIALELAPRWKELRSFANEESPVADVNLLRRALRQYRQAEDDKKAHEETLAKLGRKKPTRNDDRAKRINQEVNRLLSKRAWVLEQLEGDVSTLDMDSDDSIRLAEKLFRDAESDALLAEQNLQNFLDTREQELNEANEQPPLASEIAADSPLRFAPIEEQLEELLRRRKWLVQSHQLLLNRHALSFQGRLWITILFVLSILTVFGTQVVISYWWQLSMVALGLGGMVAAGALNAAIEKRNNLRLFKSATRLKNLDLEIEWLQEQIEEAKTAPEVPASETELATLENEVAVAKERLEEARDVYQQWLAAEEHSMHDEGELPATKVLATWIAEAAELLRQCDIRFDLESPRDILGELEWLQAHPPKFTEEEPAFVDSERDLARSELRRLEKLQRSILKRVDLTDAYDLEAAIEEANASKKQRNLKKKCERELAAEINQHEDPDEIREILDLYSIHDIQNRLDELQSEWTHLEESLLEQNKKTQPAKSNETHRQRLTRDLDQKRDDLRHLEANLEIAKIEVESLQQKKLPQPPIVVTRAVQIPWLLGELTQNRFQSVEFEPQSESFLLRTWDGKLEHLNVEHESELAQRVWIALRLRLAMIQHQANDGNVLPLALVADQLELEDLAEIYAAVSKAAGNGLQITLLIGASSYAEQLSASGFNVVRVGLNRATEPHDEEWGPNDDESAAIWAA